MGGCRVDGEQVGVKLMVSIELSGVKLTVSAELMVSKWV